MVKKTMEDINLWCKDFVENNWEECLEYGKKELEYLEHSTAKYKEETIYSLHIPKIFHAEGEKLVKYGAESMYAILTKVMDRYLSDSSYRKLFGFPKELEDMILHVPEYSNPLPICRLDIFLNEKDGTFQFCEFNSDGTSSMNEDRELNIAFRESLLHKELCKSYTIKSFELFDSWAREVKKLYFSNKKTVDKPCIAIVDFLEKACSLYEFEEFCKSFRKVGFQTVICEIRNLYYENGILYDSKEKRHKIDVIYRRAVTSDIMEHKEEVKDLLQAVWERKVCMIGDFCTQIIHNKILFYILRLPETLRFLTEEERNFIEEHIPYTVKLTRENITKLKMNENKDKWIIKPEDSYGAHGVYSGININGDLWKRLLEQFVEKNYIVQEYIEPYQSFNVDFHLKENSIKKYSNLLGLYIYNGKFAGVYARQSEKNIISTEYDENDIASLVIYDRQVI